MYKFDPGTDMTLTDVVSLLRMLNISTSSDDYLNENFPMNLKRHFSPIE